MFCAKWSVLHRREMWDQEYNKSKRVSKEFAAESSAMCQRETTAALLALLLARALICKSLRSQHVRKAWPPWCTGIRQKNNLLCKPPATTHASVQNTSSPRKRKSKMAKVQLLLIKRPQVKRSCPTILNEKKSLKNIVCKFPHLHLGKHCRIFGTKMRSQ